MNDKERRRGERLREILDNEVNNPEFYSKYPKPKKKRGWKIWKRK